MTFTLHPQLAADTHVVGDLPLCRVLLMNDSRYPWLILVPKRQGIKEISDLDPQDVDAVWPEMMKAHEALRTLTNPDKMNVGALGNMVPQLHIHIIARTQTDPAWPKPVWGHSPAVPYDDVAPMLARVRQALDIAAPTA
ncbi:MAG: HIT family protein [Alphaproteobacteria bacterium]